MTAFLPSLRLRLGIGLGLSCSKVEKSASREAEVGDFPPHAAH
jgi:hypothetical protein